LIAIAGLGSAGRRIVSREDAKPRSNPAAFAAFAISREPCPGIAGMGSAVTGYNHLPSVDP